MEKIILTQTNLFEITDKKGKIHFGGVQYWFPKKGYIPQGACGATVGANIFGYLTRTQGDKQIAEPGDLQRKAGFLEFMKKAYPFLYPRAMGLMAEPFMQGAEEFGASFGVPMRAERLKVPIGRSCRPSAEKLTAFIAESLRRDIPVAHLVLSSGQTPTLDTWHWITIIGVDEETKIIDFIDNGVRLQADLTRWLETSILGGSFVRLVPADDPSSRANASIS
ncbi:hypothetical protein AGMMS49983_21690 [Clostridia bacterium]|nr:hypothetical protein AGMMS49983_21690 [Clostridia bacterium]